MTLVGLTFTNCDLVGPAVIHAVDGCRFYGDTFNAQNAEGVESLVLGIDTNETPLGIIIFARTRFDDSRFWHIAFGHPLEVVDAEREQMAAVLNLPPPTRRVRPTPDPDPSANSSSPESEGSA